MRYNWGVRAGRTGAAAPAADDDDEDDEDEDETSEEEEEEDASAALALAAAAAAAASTISRDCLVYGARSITSGNSNRSLILSLFVIVLKLNSNLFKCTIRYGGSLAKQSRLVATTFLSQ